MAKDSMERLADAIYRTLEEELPLARKDRLAVATEKIIQVIKTHALLTRMERGQALNVACNLKNEP